MTQNEEQKNVVEYEDIVCHKCGKKEAIIWDVIDGENVYLCTCGCKWAKE